MVRGFFSVFPADVELHAAPPCRCQGEDVQDTFGISCLPINDQLDFGGEFLRFLGQLGRRPGVQSQFIQDAHLPDYNIFLLVVPQDSAP